MIVLPRAICSFVHIHDRIGSLPIWKVSYSYIQFKLVLTGSNNDVL